MDGVLAYSFRTFPRLRELSEAFADPFVFGPLRRDLPRLLDRIGREKPHTVLGVAIRKDGPSAFEPVAVNRFGGAGKSLSKNGPERLDLFVPPLPSPFVRSDRSTHSFCNWTAYRLREALGDDPVRVAFVHVRPEDVASLPDVFIP